MIPPAGAPPAAGGGQATRHLDPEGAGLLRELRERAGGNAALAEVLGVSKSAVDYWVRGRKRMSPKSRARVLALEQGDPEREQRIEAYAALVEERGGWDGGGFIWSNAPARPVAELEVSRPTHQT